MIGKLVAHFAELDRSLEVRVTMHTNCIARMFGEGKFGKLSVIHQIKTIQIKLIIYYSYS